MGAENSRLGHAPNVNPREALERWRIPVKDIRGLKKTLKQRESGQTSANTRNERIGKGHFGEVLMAEWDDKKVVVKTTRAGVDDPRRIRDMQNDLENEAFILGTIEKHPNIVDLRGIVHEESPIPFLGIVLGFCENGAMKQLWKRRNLEMRQKVRILQGIACGLAHLHREGIEHRDLWPANILIDENLSPKVADYGLAITRHTRHITNKCQFRWSSPERCKNHVMKTPKWEPKNDVWSFGMIAYWALTKQRPFFDVEKGSTVKSMILKGITPKFSSELGLDEELVKIIESCWKFSTKQRPPMRQISDELLVWLRDQPGGPHDDVAERDMLDDVYPDSHQTEGVISPRPDRSELDAEDENGDVEQKNGKDCANGEEDNKDAKANEEEVASTTTTTTTTDGDTKPEQSATNAVIAEEGKKVKRKSSKMQLAVAEGDASAPSSPSASKSRGKISAMGTRLYKGAKRLSLNLSKSTDGTPVVDRKMCELCKKQKVAAKVTYLGQQLRLCQSCTMEKQRASGGGNFVVDRSPSPLLQNRLTHSLSSATLQDDPASASADVAKGVDEAPVADAVSKEAKKSEEVPKEEASEEDNAADDVAEAEAHNDDEEKAPANDNDEQPEDNDAGEPDDAADGDADSDDKVEEKLLLSSSSKRVRRRVKDKGNKQKGANKGAGDKQRRNRPDSDFMVCVKAFQAVHRGELNLQKGDIVMITDRRDDMWKGVKATHKKGWFPPDIVEQATAAQRRELEGIFDYLRTVRNKDAPAATSAAKGAAADTNADNNNNKEKLKSESSKRRTKDGVARVLSMDELDLPPMAPLEVVSPKRSSSNLNDTKEAKDTKEKSGSKRRHQKGGAAAGTAAPKTYSLEIMPPRARHRLKPSPEKLQQQIQRQQQGKRTFKVTPTTTLDELYSMVRSKFSLPARPIDIAVIGSDSASKAEPELVGVMSTSSLLPFDTHAGMLSEKLAFVYEVRFRDANAKVANAAADAAKERQVLEQDKKKELLNAETESEDYEDVEEDDEEVDAANDNAGDQIQLRVAADKVRSASPAALDVADSDASWAYSDEDNDANGDAVKEALHMSEDNGGSSNDSDLSDLDDRVAFTVPEALRQDDDDLSDSDAVVETAVPLTRQSTEKLLKKRKKEKKKKVHQHLADVEESARQSISDLLRTPSGKRISQPGTTATKDDDESSE